MIDNFVEQTVCDYFNVSLSEAMNKNVHTRRATEARYYIWFFLRYYHRYPVIMMAEIYGFSRRQVHQGISFVRDASKIQHPFIIKALDLRKLLGYSELPSGKTKRMYVRRNCISALSGSTTM